METKEYVVYSFDELSDKAKEKARMQFDFLMDSLQAEYRDALNKFCDMLGFDVKNWEVSAFGNIDYTLDRLQIHKVFRGKKKKELLKLPQYLTGFWVDDYLMESFKSEIKIGSTPYDAIDRALYAFFRAWRDDMEHAISDENISEFCNANGIVFFENGDVAP